MKKRLHVIANWLLILRRGVPTVCKRGEKMRFEYKELCVEIEGEWVRGTRKGWNLKFILETLQNAISININFYPTRPLNPVPCTMYIYTHILFLFSLHEYESVLRILYIVLQLEIDDFHIIYLHNLTPFELDLRLLKVIYQLSFITRALWDWDWE